ncbi:hypothetical protein PIB30_059212 [Stylosanthes scabra]|uniref:SMC hinge domain-containing protein n=1 Tax=Stylosanthes scabra TaxID=79078 RepID=A0ABU6YJ35_9FABA|nr:hypothetical protein [Stylosanthes scabra]
MLKELTLLKWQEKATKMALHDTAAKMDEKHEIISKLEENLKAERDKIQESKQALEEIEAKHNKHLKRQEELDSDMRKCKEEFKEFERQDVKFQEDLKHVTQKIKKLADKVEKDSAKHNALEKEDENSTDLMTKLEDNIPKLQQLLLDEEKILEEIIDSSKVETENFRSELAKIPAELEPWEKDLIEHKGKLDVASAETKLLNEKHEASHKAFKEAQNQMKSISETIKSKTGGISQIRGDIEKSKRDAAEAHKVEEECIKEQDALIPLEQAARQKVAELKSLMDSEKSQGSVLKAILKAKETKQIEGIYGRMGDLGAIDGEEKQVELLPMLKKKVSTPEGVPRLFDLVKVHDERMKLAFFVALRNTVVAKDLDQATRIAYGGNHEYRQVVTLDGALFEKSGTMSGGGNKPRGGKMGTSIRATSVSAEAIANAEKELSELTNKLNDIRQGITDAVRQYQAAEKAIGSLEMELAKSQKEVILSSESEKILFFELLVQGLEVLCFSTILLQLKKVISAEEREDNRLTDGSKRLKEKAAELQKNIENAGGEKLKSQKAKVQKIQSDIDKNQSEINRHKVQIETGQNMMKKLIKGIEESNDEVKRLTDEKVKLEANFKEIERKAFDVQECYKKIEKLINEHKDVLDEAKSEY